MPIGSFRRKKLLKKKNNKQQQLAMQTHEILYVFYTLNKTDATEWLKDSDRHGFMSKNSKWLDA